MSDDSWNFEADFGGVTAATGMGAPSREGVYEVEIISTDMTETRKGAPRARFTARIVEGDMTGRTIYDGLNVPRDKAEWAKLSPFWAALLQSVGHDTSKWKKKKLNPKAVLGRRGYVYFKPAPEGSYPTVKWISKADYMGTKDIYNVAVDSTPTSVNGKDFDEDTNALDQVLDF
tara:strand:- start:236 stop:757 length:522 start_codon:yes stop_codon:yes gene_type:complete